MVTAAVVAAAVFEGPPPVIFGTSASGLESL